MKLHLTIRRESDKMIATDIWPKWEYNTFWWEEGNASCDCNRELFFARALKQADPETTECGHTRYKVRCTDADTGRILFTDLFD